MYQSYLLWHVSLNENENIPVLLFIDEIDSLIGTRSSEVGGEIRVKNQFLTEMDGINGKSKEIQLYVIGATNKPWSLEAGLSKKVPEANLCYITRSPFKN